MSIIARIDQATADRENAERPWREHKAWCRVCRPERPCPTGQPLATQAAQALQQAASFDLTDREWQQLLAEVHEDEPT